MKRLILAVSVLMMLILPGWGQNTPSDQAKMGVAAHREQARNNSERRHHRRKHRRHHRHHTGA
jgi:hypothetical protein